MMSNALSPTRSTSATKPTIGWFGVVGAVLGVVAGVVELVIGPSIRPWIGDKHDTLRLGLATMALSAVAFVAAWVLAHRSDVSSSHRMLCAVAMLIPGVVCFTTVGRLWYPAGTVLVSSALITLYGARTDLPAVARTIARAWAAVLMVTLGLMYVGLGAAASGVSGAFGIAGGLVAIAVVVTRRRHAVPISLGLLLLGVVPFALLTWWSLVTPIVAGLLVALGLTVLTGCDVLPELPAHGRVERGTS
jgi:hypothetical protein